MAASAVKQVGTKLQLFGITNQNHAAEVFGDIVFYGTDGAAVLNGTAFLNLQQVGLTDGTERKSSMNQAGGTCLLIFHDQKLMISITAIPEGSSLPGAADNNDPLLSIKLGPAGCFCKLENFPDMDAVGVEDIFNSANWVYEGGAQLTALADDKWGYTFNLTRYVAGGITKQALR